MDLKKHATNRIVIPISHCYQTVGKQGPLFTYRDICAKVIYIAVV